ncbi:hypothetical protein HDU93_006463, partial [Gonapodya sp. JEL0774]
DALHGPLSPNSADVYLWYGKSLLKTAVQSAGLFDGKAGRRDRKGEGEGEGEGESGKGEGKNGDDGDDDDEDEDGDDGDADSDDDAISTGEDDDDFSLAWEVLEVARTVLEKVVERESAEGDKGSHEGKKKLAEQPLPLGALLHLGPLAQTILPSPDVPRAGRGAPPAGSRARERRQG